MAIYKVLATKVGLTLNYEYITESAIASFGNAFPSEVPCFFGHRSEKFPNPPQVGKVLKAYVQDGDTPYEAYADIDFLGDFAQNFATGNKYDISVYALCMSHYDEKGIRIIDELMPSDQNSIDVVEYGAVPDARVLDKISDSVNNEESYIRCSMRLELTENKLTKGTEAGMEREEIIKAIKDGLGDETIADAIVERVTDAVDGIITSSINENLAAQTQEDNLDVIAEAFSQGAQSALDGKSIERVADSIKSGTSIKDAVEKELALVKEFEERFSASEKVIKNACHSVASNTNTTMSARALVGLEER